VRRFTERKKVRKSRQFGELSKIIYGQRPLEVSEGYCIKGPSTLKDELGK
jgi:hypothetical protein